MLWDYGMFGLWYVDVLHLLYICVDEKLSHSGRKVMSPEIDSPFFLIQK